MDHRLTPPSDTSFEVVCQIKTFNSPRSKASIKDIIQGVCDRTEELVGQITTFIPDREMGDHWYGNIQITLQLGIKADTDMFLQTLKSKL